MKALAERMADLDSVATSPNGGLSARITARTDVRVSVEPNFYAHATATDLERQAVALARLLLADANRDYYRALSQHQGRLVTGTVIPTRDEDRDYYAALGRLAPSGRSSDGAVELTCLGMQHFAVTVDPSAKASMSAEQMANAMSEAANRMLADQEQQAARLRWDIYIGTPIPGLA
jgi:hypothetical protein